MIQKPHPEKFELAYTSTWASLVAQRLKHLPVMWETQVWSLGQEDPVEKEMATHSSVLAWRIPWTEEAGRLQSTGSQRVRHDWAASLSHWYICIRMFFAMLLIIAPNWKEAKCLQTGEWTHQLWTSHTMEHKKIVKANELYLHKTTWLNFKPIVGLKKNNSQKTTCSVTPFL